MLSEWLSWRESVEEELREERERLGIKPEGEEEEGAEGKKVVEEIVEEVLDETEEIVGR